MHIKWGIKDRDLFVALIGELDHHAAKKILTEMSQIVDDNLPLHCEMDLSGLSFMDSSGIAVILGVYRRLYEIGGGLYVYNVPKQVIKVLAAAGVDKIIPVSAETADGKTVTGGL